ncbi:MAG: hypothetical protein ACR2Q3_13500 [Woeseiaceae bacterium]
MSGYVKLTVIGGSSPATPVLMLALSRAISKSELPPLRISLWGRNQRRLERINNYVDLARREDPSYRVSSDANFQISCHDSLAEALSDATHILCQIRPGGMSARSLDEQLALNAGLPGDEGIGPGGLAAFLRGRQTMEDILAECSRTAPSAVFLQMTSPLSLMTGLTSDYYSETGFGVCELPTTTLRRISRHVEDRLGFGSLQPALAGLNHRSWFYGFRDQNGVDRTLDVLDAITDGDLVQVDPRIIRQYGAIPVHYLSLFLHSKRHVSRQRDARQTRGEELSDWSTQLDRAYCHGAEVDYRHVTKLLRDRNIDWYKEGVLPALKALLSSEPVRLPLNLPNRGSIQGVPDNAIIEIYAHVHDGAATPTAVPPLPELPGKLTRELVGYEQAVLALPPNPSPEDVHGVLTLHPLCRSGNFSELAAEISHASKTGP